HGLSVPKIRKETSLQELSHHHSVEGRAKNRNGGSSLFCSFFKGCNKKPIQRAKVSREEGMRGGRGTVLRLVRTAELPAAVPPKKVGVDDWAWKRGHRYGTLLCDLERAITIDLLPDRSVETVAAWFAAHPSIELISRDGSSEYAAAALK